MVIITSLCYRERTRTADLDRLVTGYGHILPAELHGTIYLIPPRKLRAATHASIYPIRTIGLACQIIDDSFCMLLCHSNHSALVDSLHAPTQPYTTTYPCMLLYHSNQSQLVSLTDSELPLYCGRYSRIGYRPSHFHHLSGLFRCCLFAGFIMSIVCLLAGIATARPSAFVEGKGFEPSLCCRTVSDLFMLLLR